MSSKTNDASNKKSKFVRRLIEYTVIGASCTYLGMQVAKKYTSK